MFEWLKKRLPLKKKVTGCVSYSPGFEMFRRYLWGHATLEDFRNVKVLKSYREIYSDGTLGPEVSNPAPSGCYVWRYEKDCEKY